MLRPRLFVEAGLAADGRVGLSTAQLHYLRHVLRLEAGASIVVFNGRDGEWLARVNALGKAGGTATAETQLRLQKAGRDVWLCFAPVKKEAIDTIVRQATELGAAVLQPVLTRHTDVQRVNLDRLRANAVEATEQSERLDVPELRPPVGLDALLAGWPAERLLLVAAEAGAARPMIEVARETAGRPAALLVGPEGGLAPAELDALGDLPFVRAVGLGPRILRADTAAAAALACWQMLAGDGCVRPPDRA